MSRNSYDNGLMGHIDDQPTTEPSHSAPMSRDNTYHRDNPFKTSLRAFGLIVMDIVLICVGSWIVYLFFFAITGWKQAYYDKMGNNLNEYFATSILLLGNLWSDGKISEWISRKGFNIHKINAIFFIIALLGTFPLAYGEAYILKTIYQLPDTQLGWEVLNGALSVHIVIIYFVYCYNGCILNGAWGGCDGWKMTVNLYIISWAIFGVIGNNIMNNTIFTVPGVSVVTEGQWGSMDIWESLIMSVIITTLVVASIASPMYHEFIDDNMPNSERVAVTAVPIFLFSVFQWGIFLGFSLAVYKSASFMLNCGSTTQLLLYSWFGYMILGYRVTPHLYPMMVHRNPRPSLVGLIFYYIICFVLHLVLVAILYAFFHFITWPYLWVKIFGYNTALEHYQMPDVTFTLIMGNIYLRIFANFGYVQG